MTRFGCSLDPRQSSHPSCEEPWTAEVVVVDHEMSPGAGDGVSLVERLPVDVATAPGSSGARPDLGCAGPTVGRQVPPEMLLPGRLPAAVSDQEHGEVPVAEELGSMQEEAVEDEHGVSGGRLGRRFDRKVGRFVEDGGAVAAQTAAERHEETLLQ